MKARITDPASDAYSRETLGMPRRTGRIQAGRRGFLSPSGYSGHSTSLKGTGALHRLAGWCWQKPGTAGPQEAAGVAEVIPGDSQPRHDSLGSPSVCQFPSSITSAPRPGSNYLVKFAVSCPSLLFSLYATVFLIHLYFEKLPFSQSGLHFRL